MSLKEIDKLREKVEKDPNSKLFVPLAEEYRKEGMLDDAVDVLLKGIEAQPAYMSARVSLGKIYLEKGMPAEARTEFESVVSAIPDNLYAQKKLAEIYRDLGERELAMKSYRTVLKLNALDEEAAYSLKTLEDSEEEPPAASGPEEFPQPEAPEAEVSDALHAGEAPELPEDPSPVEEPAEPEAPGADAEDDLRAFKDSLFGMTGAQGGEPEAATATDLDMGEEEAFEVIEEETEEAGSEVSFEEINAALQSEVQAIEEAAEETEETSVEEVEQTEEEISAEAEIPEDLLAGAAASFDDPVAAPQKGPTIEEAERRIAEGNYAGAVNIYRNILTLHPGDKQTMQRLEELRVLLKLLGKDKEVLIERLDAFLKSIEKRHDEFLRRA